MGFDLSVFPETGDSKYFRWSSFSWGRLLRMALEHGGWEPEGTSAPCWTEEQCRYWRVEHWDGDYSSNDRQMISKFDAKNIASALRKALLKLPPEDWMDTLVSRLGLPEETTVEVVWYDKRHQPGEVVQSRDTNENTWHTYYVATDLEIFATSRSTIEEFIEFCELGPISIG